jgi:DNA-binding NtrC family response regulator
VRSFSPEAEALLVAYPWPGNVRELRNVVERIVILETDETILPEHLPPEISGLRPGGASAAFDIGSLFPRPLSEVEEAYIEAVVKRAGGNKTKAAEILGITRQTLRSKLD